MSETSFKEWHESLDPDVRAQIRALHRLDKRWNLVAAFFALNWVAAGWILLSTDAMPVRIFCTVWIAVSLHGLANLLHEASHGNLFRRPALDRLVGFACGVPALISFTAYQVTHKDHHRYNRGPLDPDEFMNITNNRGLLSALFYVWLFVGTLLYLVHVPVTAIARGNARERTRFLAEYAAMFAIYALLILSSLEFGFFDAVVAVWLIPVVVTQFFGNIRGWAEHMLTKKGHPLTESRTVTANRVFSFFNVNLNYHAEHHLYPGMPWYNLPKLHRLLLPEYRRVGTSVYRSYALFLFDAVRYGVHGLAPKVSPVSG